MADDPHIDDDVEISAPTPWTEKDRLEWARELPRPIGPIYADVYERLAEGKLTPSETDLELNRRLGAGGTT